MIKILLVDDSYDKAANIIKVVRSISEDISIEIVIDFIAAQQKLITFKYDLLILDLNLPIRDGDSPSIENGKNLLNEINRKTEIKSPYYIINVTQYYEECQNASDIWQTIKYSPENTSWKSPIGNLIKHIKKTDRTIEFVEEIKPTIFVEGKTDSIYITEAIKLFKPDLLNKVQIIWEKSAGASWVARKIITWAHSLKKDANGYIKAVGLLDGDIAGKNANDEINRVVTNNSAESTTFRIFKLSASYARHIVSIKQKGLDMPVCIEDLIPPQFWVYAKDQEWLETRTNIEALLSNPSSWNRFDTSLKEYLTTLNLSDEEKMYLCTIKNDKKDQFSKYIINLSIEERTNAFLGFKKLINEIDEYLFPEAQKK